MAVIQSDKKTQTNDEGILDLKQQLKEQKYYMKKVCEMLISKVSIDDGAVTTCFIREYNFTTNFLWEKQLLERKINRFRKSMGQLNSHYQLL